MFKRFIKMLLSEMNKKVLGIEFSPHLHQKFISMFEYNAFYVKLQNGAGTEPYKCVEGRCVSGNSNKVGVA